MNRHKAISQRLLLAAIFIGLNALCFLGVIHGRHVHRHTRVNYSHITAHSSRGGSRDDDSGRAGTIELPQHVAVAVATHIHRVAPVLGGTFTPTPAGLSSGLVALVRPEEQAELLVRRENILAPGGSPRSPALGRAPPVA
jgi:hypothetical protein